MSKKRFIVELLIAVCFVILVGILFAGFYCALRYDNIWYAISGFGITTPFVVLYELVDICEK